MLFISISASCSSTDIVVGNKTKVGREHHLYLDHTRTNWESSGPRPISTTIWYPAKPDSVESPWQMGPSFAPIFKVGYSALNAEILNTKVKYPLIILSHGTGGASTHLAWLAEHLASNGYIVAAVDHHDNTAIEDKYYPHGFLLWWERPKDLTFLLDKLLSDSKFSRSIDKGRIGAAGFSLDGYSVLDLAGAKVSLEKLEAYCNEHPHAVDCNLPPEAPFGLAEIERLKKSDPFFLKAETEHRLSYGDKRVKAVFVIAPAIGPALTEESLSRIAIPTEIVVGKLDDIAPAETNGDYLAANIPTSQIIFLDNVSHYTFLSECGWLGKLTLPFVQDGLCKDNKNINRKEVHDKVAQEALVFFNRSL